MTHFLKIVPNQNITPSSYSNPPITLNPIDQNLLVIEQFFNYLSDDEQSLVIVKNSLSRIILFA